MSYGIIEYDATGKPICEICGKSFHRVLSHVRLKHNMNHKEYKTKFGLDIKKGICSEESKNISRQYVLNNYDKCITANLIKNGKNTRFKKGSEGRKRNKVSEQTRLKLIEHMKKIHDKKELCK